MDIGAILQLVNAGIEVAGTIKKAHVTQSQNAAGETQVTIDLTLNENDAKFDDALAAIDKWNLEHPV